MTRQYSSAAWCRSLRVLALLPLLIVGTARGQVEVVVVTTQKRDQPVTDVPISISVYSQENLRNLGVRTPEDIELLTPGIEVNSNGGVGVKTYTMRGVGFNDYSAGASSTVGLYFDEIAVPYPVMTSGMLFDIDRVEVVKGPQGDLYGRNTTAGQISFIGRRPTDEFEAGLSAGVGTYETIDIEGYVSGGLGENSRGRIAFAGTNSGKGWQRSLTRPDDELGQIDRMALRATIDWQISNNIEFLLTAHHNDDQSENIAPTAFDGTLVGLPFPTRRGPLFNSQGELEQLVVFSNENNDVADWTNGPNNALRPKRDNQLTGVVGKFTWRVGELEFVSLTGYDEFKRNEANDWDGATLIDASNINVTDIDVFSQEIRVQGAADRFNWLAGVYYSADDLSEDYNFYFGEGRFGINQIETRYSQDTDSLAAFGHVEWDLSAKTGLNLGLRLSSEERTWSGCTYDNTPPDLAVPGFPLNFFYNNIINAPGVLTPNGLLNDAFNFPNGLPPVQPLMANACGTFNDILNSPGAGQYGLYSERITNDGSMWRASLHHHPRNDLMVFGSISKGFKSGGFNGANSNTHSQLLPYRPEELVAYEVGVKTILPGRSLQFDASMFYYDYKDKQEREAAVTPVGNLAGIANVPKSVVQGVEGDMLWRPNERFSMGVGLSFLDTEIKEWMAVDDLASAFPVTILFDASGAELPNAPRFSGNVSIAYEAASGSRFRLTPMIDIVNRGETKGDIAPENMREEYTLTNVRLIIEPSGNDKWALHVWARNIFDEEYYVSGQVGGNFTVTRINGMPRTAGMSFDYRF